MVFTNRPDQFTAFVCKSLLKSKHQIVLVNCNQPQPAVYVQIRYTILALYKSLCMYVCSKRDGRL